MSGLSVGLLLAGCAEQIDTSKYVIPKRDAQASFIRSARADTNPDGTPVHPYPVGTPSYSVGRYLSSETRNPSDSTSAAQQDNPRAASDIKRRTIDAGTDAQGLDKTTTPLPVSGRSRQRFETPVIGTERWDKEQEESDRLDRELNARLQGSICRKC